MIGCMRFSLNYPILVIYALDGTDYYCAYCGRGRDCEVLFPYFSFFYFTEFVFMQALIRDGPELWHMAFGTEEKDVTDA